MVAWLCDRVIDGDYVVIPLLIVLVRIGIVRLAIWRVGSLRMISGLIVGAAVLVVVGLVGKRMRAQEKRVPTEDGIVYGVADGQALTMDYYAPKGPLVHGETLHPITIIIHGGGYHGGDAKSGSEAYVADFLAPAGYAVFSVNYRLAPKYPYPYMVLDVQRAVQFIRHNAKHWEADPDRISLVGGSAGGFLSNMVGLLNAAGDPNATDPVDRESAECGCASAAGSVDCGERREGSDS
jgi:carboxylesterase type B